ncbi:MAG: DUF6285 domain-containing protein [Myxococcota bacterium]|nr:DUF6285 domain-containing protein [Myxococcota bacterium]MDW8361562.1 DUF6285 domain-containing protein [Myxococcales bacterium]
MLERPDPAALLEALARFLAEDLRTAVERPDLAYRLRIAAHLCGSLAAQWRSEPDESSRTRLEAEGMLRQLRAELPPGTAPDSDQAHRDPTVELARRIRTAPYDAAAFDALLAALREPLARRLRLRNPRFDLAERFEDD